MTCRPIVFFAFVASYHYYYNLTTQHSYQNDENTDKPRGTFKESVVVISWSWCCRRLASSTITLVATSSSSATTALLYRQSVPSLNACALEACAVRSEELWWLPPLPSLPLAGPPALLVPQPPPPLGKPSQSPSSWRRAGTCC
jgi:hypothetical protein